MKILFRRPQNILGDSEQNGISAFSLATEADWDLTNLTKLKK